MPAKFWGEAVKTAVYILNRSPIKGVVDDTPYQAWFDKIPKVHHSRIFWCLAHARIYILTFLNLLIECKDNYVGI